MSKSEGIELTILKNILSTE